MHGAGRPVDAPSTHQRLRDATQDAHEALDAAFGSLDLARKADFVRFLAAHAIGLAPLYPAFAAFVADELLLAPPPFPDMLRRDLDRLGVDAASLPAITLERSVHPAAVTYVLAGSRLGLAMIRKQDHWGRNAGLASEYLNDNNGPTVWRALSAWMAASAPDEADLAAMRDSARLAFGVFRRAFALSAGVEER